MAFNAVILAAGEGKRMKSDLPKVLHQVCGKSLVDWVIDAVNKVGSAKNIVVVGHKADEVKAHLGSSVEYALQSQQLGTGHAVQMAAGYLTEEDTLVTCGDMPLLNWKSLVQAYNLHKESGNSITLFTAEVKNPFGYGRVIRDGECVSHIVEQKDATDEEKLITEINSGTYFFKTKDLIEALSKLKNNNSQSEYYLTDTLKILIDDGKRAGSYVTDDCDEILGVNDQSQLAEAEEIKKRQLA
ncbi:MAG: NTP transferase domain-containing protein [Eubacteriales bacterium]|nr:NTP transferase domain-containing protein [Eubacteriales bacterium]